MHYEILDNARHSLVPNFSRVKDRFYLAGGTALALRFGHRESVDFDFFSPESFDTGKLFEELRAIFAEHRVIKIQEEENTLGILLDEGIKISFMTYPYPLLENPTEEPYLRIASVLDIACMKLSAITGRSANKDYIDIFFILKSLPLKTLLDAANRKFPSVDTNLFLKSLVYFDDIVEEPLRMRPEFNVLFSEVKSSLKEAVKEYFKHH